MGTKTFDALFARFNSLVIPLSVAAGLAGLAPTTARSLCSRGQLPFPSIKVVGKRMVRLDDFASWFDGLGLNVAAAYIEADAPPKKRGRGRPRKGV